ncbi:MAG: GIY-YIG nuclease family protein [Treponema sp.]|nr:GIY-YIG nuclease family protein [Treponema sp.]
MDKIMLNDILRIDNLKNVKFRFLMGERHGYHSIENFKNKDYTNLLAGHYWNYSKNKSYKINQLTFGFIRIKENEDLWLLYHASKIIKDLNVLNGIGYEHEILYEYEKYFGRLVIKYKNDSQNLIRNADSVINKCEFYQILPDIFDNDIFPGYDKVKVSWLELSRVIDKDSWKTALQNQKGVYLITDKSNGKMYVGSAYGDNMILGRWKSYINNGHGGNVGLKKVDFEHIKNHFYFTILDIYKSTIDDKIIIERESWWKDVLNSREYGYNEN